MLLSCELELVTKGFALVSHLIPIECGMGDLGSLHYHQIHKGSFAEFVLCLSPTWELLAVIHTAYSFLEL